MNAIDFNFNENDWIFEISSGYPGYRNTIIHKWIHCDIYNKNIKLLEEFERFKELAVFFEYTLYEEDAESFFTKFKETGFLILKN